VSDVPPRRKGRSALAFLASELSGLPDRIAHLETRIGEMADRAGPDAGTVIALQDLDLLRQTLDDLARFAEAARSTSCCEVHPEEDYSHLLKLRDLRDRLLDRDDADGRDPSAVGPFEKLDAPASGG